MTKVGIFGGTFDPIHNGHIITMQKLLEIRGLDKIIIIPCNISPHKLLNNGSEAVHRLNMVNLVYEGNPNFEISDYEINNKEISYTYKTLHYFKKKYSEIELIIGFDNLVVFDEWIEPDDIVKNAKLIVMKRTSLNEIHANRFFEYAEFVETPVIDISSTEIRERVRKRLSIQGFVPESVQNYIYSNNLYSAKF